MPYPRQWKLDNFFTEKSAKTALDTLIHNLLSLKETSIALHEFILTLQQYDMEFKELESFILCQLSENTENKAALVLNTQLLEANQHLNDLFTQLEAQMQSVSLETLLKHPKLKTLEFFLKEKYTEGSLKLSTKEEYIINALEPDGYHGLMTLYDHLKNQISIPSYDGQKQLSYPEAENCLSDVNRHVRAHIHQSLESAFQSHEDLYAEILNHIAGFRLKVYELRNWQSFLEEPLRLNRLKESTLNALFSTVEKHKHLLSAFFVAKAKALNISKLAWYDIEAPISSLEPNYSFEQGANLVLRCFGKLSPRLKEFAHKALSSHYLDVEERKHKRAGGFCTTFPQSKETRIFMSYKGTFDNVTTLAHELGHAFHAKVTEDLDLFNQDYPMNLAETASTMCEQILLDQIIYEISSEKEKLMLLDKKIARHTAYLMNLPARFYFEKAFYEERKKGFVGPAKLSELMLVAQQKAFDNTLSTYHPQFWASKLHFYFTDAPFYNFPYTFGYLFSLSTYLELNQDPKTFESRFIALLQDTGRMSTEELAQKHLHVDLSDPSFFERALLQVEKDVNAYLDLCKTQTSEYYVKS